jgi:surfactin synthase thioesterase subunit
VSHRREPEESLSPDVVLFPGAGSFGAEFRTLLREFAPSAWLVRYPGRAGRDFGRGAASFPELVRSCEDQVRRRHPSRPVLVGHSFGAYVAFAVAARSNTPISALVVAGANSPRRARVPEPVTLDRAALGAYLDGLYPESDASAEWAEVVLETAMRDLRLLREFTPSEYPALRCPVHAVRGETDRLTTMAGLGEWQSVTSGEVTHREFAGGHSDLLQTPALVSWLRESTPAHERLSGG